MSFQSSNQLHPHSHPHPPSHHPFQNLWVRLNGLPIYTSPLDLSEFIDSIVQGASIHPRIQFPKPQSIHLIRPTQQDPILHAILTFDWTSSFTATTSSTDQDDLGPEAEIDRSFTDLIQACQRLKGARLDFNTRSNSSIEAIPSPAQKFVVEPIVILPTHSIVSIDLPIIPHTREMIDDPRTKLEFKSLELFRYPPRDRHHLHHRHDRFTPTPGGSSSTVHHPRPLELVDSLIVDSPVNLNNPTIEKSELKAILEHQLRRARSRHEDALSARRLTNHRSNRPSPYQRWIEAIESRAHHRRQRSSRDL